MKPLIYIYILAATLLMLCSCSVDRHIADGEYMLNKVTVSADDETLLKTYALSDYVTQNTNTKWFGARVPLKIYCLSGTEDTGFNRFVRKLGQAPVLYSKATSAKQMDDIEKVLGNAGYLKAEVVERKTVKGKKMNVDYHVVPGEHYSIRNVTRVCDDPGLEHFICADDTAASLLKSGRPFDINMLSSERSRIVTYLTNHGYYRFTKDNISFRADTAAGSSLVDVTLRVSQYQADSRSDVQPHRAYTIGNVTFVSGVQHDNDRADTTWYRGYKFVTYGEPAFRRNLLTSHSLLKTGDPYKASNFKQTFNYYNRLSAVAASNIKIDELGDTLDCTVTINHAKPHSLGCDVEATNSAGDLGAALSASYQNKNLFRGSELLTLKVRTAYEAITGLEGYDGHNYIEFGTEARVSFPSFLLPGVNRKWGTVHNAESEISLSYNRQDRPEFDRRVFTAAWRYKWTSRDRHLQHRFDLLEVSYVNMPWISSTFKEQYLDSLGKTNAILKYNYENLLITKTGYSFSFNSLGERERTYGKNAYTVRINLESSGTPLSALATALNTRKNDDGQRTFLGIAYAQYVRADIDLAKSIRIDKDNSVAMHFALGIAYPYGNSNQLPFEKRYFAGGANSVRGWSVRSLGPGSYKGRDKGINFLNQSGDVKLDLSLEYRAQLFWKLSGAAFIDAGNIWTIRNYKDQPGGQFQFDTFLKEVAASYGLGLRMDANFFIVRFDAGMKAINPAESGREHYPLLHPAFGRDFAFHFAVGMPF